MLCTWVQLLSRQKALETDDCFVIMIGGLPVMEVGYLRYLPTSLCPSVLSRLVILGQSLRRKVEVKISLKKAKLPASWQKNLKLKPDRLPIG